MHNRITTPKATHMTYVCFTRRAVLAVVGYAPATVEVTILVRNTPQAVAKYLAEHPGALATGHSD
jgi:hypothetical protein